MNKFLDNIEAKWELEHRLTNDEFQWLLNLAKANDTALIREAMINLTKAVEKTLNKLKGD